MLANHLPAASAASLAVHLPLFCILAVIGLQAHSVAPNGTANERHRSIASGLTTLQSHGVDVLYFCQTRQQGTIPSREWISYYRVTVLATGFAWI